MITFRWHGEAAGRSAEVFIPEVQSRRWRYRIVPDQRGLLLATVLWASNDVVIGAQPDKGLRDADAELLGEHPGGLVDLGAVQGPVRWLAGRARPGLPRRLAGGI